MSKRTKQTIYMALFISLASQVQFSFLTDGFIVALSVVVMAIFIYCYRDLSALYIGFLSGVFAPTFRLLVVMIGEGGKLGTEIARVYPDIVFFFVYGIAFTAIYRYVIRGSKDTRNFPFVIFFCDILSNLGEMTARSIVCHSNLMSLDMLMALALIAICRTALIMVIVVAIESYTSLLVRQEHDEEYRRLLLQASTIEAEMRVMNRNVAEVEQVMKEAYDIYKELREGDYPHTLADKALEIAKDTHEVKANYENVLSVLNKTYLNGVSIESMEIADLFKLEKRNMEALFKKRGYRVELTTRVRTSFRVKESFKMMSVLRNLLTNAAEALGAEGGRIIMSVQLLPAGKSEDGRHVSEAAAQHTSELSADTAGGSGPQYLITVWDNGPGIPQDELELIFMDGYSSKFDEETGQIQRGFGLCLVKDYIENVFGGRVEIDTRCGSDTDPRQTETGGSGHGRTYTMFNLYLPVENMERSLGEV